MGRRKGRSWGALGAISTGSKNTRGLYQGFHGYYVEAMCLLPLGFMVRVGVSYLALVIQVVEPVSTNCASSHPAQRHPVSRIIPVVYSHSPAKPPSEITKGHLWPFSVFLTTSFPSLETGVCHGPPGVPRAVSERPICSNHDGMF